MFPSGLFPSLIFPPGLFPGAGKGTLSPTSFEQNLLAYLSGLSLVVYPGHIPQGIEPPAYVLSFIHGTPKYKLKGPAGLGLRTYQISSISTDYLETIDMEIALGNTLNGFRGAMGTSYVSSSRLLDAFDLPYEENVNASDQGTYQRAAEYQFLITESIPTF